MSKTNFRMLIGLLLLGAGIALIFLVAKNVSAATLTVDDDGNAEYETIQEAIDAAENGDTIRVWEGTYYENVVVNKSISLIGDGIETTTIDGGSGDVVQITVNWVNLSGFDIIGNKDWKDAGIRVESNHTIISNNRCATNNHYGMYLLDSSHCTIENNIISNNLKGVYLIANSDYCTIINNTILSNNGDGIYLQQCSSCTIQNNTCKNNWYGSNLFSSHENTLGNNTCSSNGDRGIYLSRSTYNTISNNTVSGSSVGIFIKTYSWYNTAHYNDIYNNSEYGIDASNNTDFTINATSCYWGAASGPYHSTKNSEGEGDNITDYVEFDPWLEKKVFWPPKAYIDLILPDPAVEGVVIRLIGRGTGTASIIRYAWNSSIDREFYNGTESEIFFESLSLGNHTIYFKVQDENGVWSDEVSADIIVTERPIAFIDTISPELALQWQTVLFEGHGTDDGSIARYVWTSDLNDELQNGSTCNFSASSLLVGTHTISLKVQDNHGIWSELVNGTLMINGQPEAEIISISRETSFEGETVSFKGQGADDDTVERYVWHSDLDNELHNGSTCNFSTSSLSNGTHQISLRVQDDLGAWSEADTSTITIIGIPRIVMDTMYPEFVNEGEAVTFTANGTGEAFITEYYWMSDLDGVLYQGPESTFTISNLTNGTHTILLRVRDNYAIWSTEVFKILVVNGLPRAQIISITPNPADEDQQVTFTGSGMDNGAITRYSWRSSIDGFLNNDTAGSFSRALTTPGNHTIYYKIMDDLGVWSEEVEAFLEVKEVVTTGNKKPTLTITSPKDGEKISGKVTIKGSVSDEDGTVEKVEISMNNDNWRSISLNGTTSWEFEWDIEQIDNGEYIIKVRSYDGTSFSDEVIITVRVEKEVDEVVDDDTDDSTPGFDVVIAVGAVVICSGFYMNRGSWSRKQNK